MLDFACAKEWQILATITQSVHLVRSSKTRLSLSHHTCSTLREQAANTVNDMLQQCGIQSTYDSLYGLATISTLPVNPMYFKNRDIDLPTSTNISYSHRTSCCFSTTPTNTSYSHRSSSCLSTTSSIPATDINHLADNSNNYPRTYIRPCKLDE